MNKTKGAWRRMRLALAFSAVIFLIILLTMMVVYAGMYMFSYLGIPIMDSERFPMFYFSLASLIVGTAIAFLTSSLPLRPIRKVMDATDRIAGGDYSVRLDERGNSDFRELYRKFNHMAAELGSVEMLRTNFVNDFSHEFKTPIVSIRGFAKILKQDDLTVQERDEYLDIIIQESERLAELSANVLKLSRIEQQTILTDQKKYNLSEQIRGSIVMMDNKWNQRQMDFQMYGSETYLTGNAGLLKEVWLNLLDNAIKFSPDG